jgi:hypothetical protein
MTSRIAPSSRSFHRFATRFGLALTWLPVALAFLIVLYSSAADAMEANTTFSSRKSGEVPVHTNETEFTCSDTIYALIDVKGLEEGIHEIEIHWLDPRGDRQEFTQFSAHAASEDTLIWGWMRLHAPENSGLVRTFDPAHGMRSFIGKWTVRVYINGRQVSTSHFDVLC